jgi:glycosyltransferase involved in cell wall biosynthesis
MTPPLRVMFVANSLSGGGAEASAVKVFHALIDSGIDIRLVAINNTEELSTQFSSRIRVLDRKWKSGTTQTLRIFFKFLFEVRSFKPTIVVAHCELPELYSAFIPWTGIRIIAVEHTSQPWRGRKVIGFLVRTTLRIRKASWVTVINGNSKIWSGERNPILIANPVSKNMELETNRMPERFVFIGRLRSEKRPQIAISASVHNNVSIAVIGVGEMLDDLRSEFSDYGNLVTYYGFVENPWAKLHPDSLIIMPSEYEGDGLVAVEAIINGFAILLSDNPDMRRLNLSSKHYFKTLEDLEQKISLAKNLGNSHFAVPLTKQNEVESARNLEKIVCQWMTLFSTLTN